MRQINQRASASLGTVKTNVRTGIPYHEIVCAAEETKTDLIVIGTHVRSGLARMFMGSTAERVVRHAPCPVMVIREREHDFIDESERAARKTTKLKGGRYGNGSKEKRSRKARHYFADKMAFTTGPIEVDNNLMQGTDFTVIELHSFV